MDNGSRSGRLNGSDMTKIVKVFAWAFASAIVAGLIAVAQSESVPVEIMAYIPLVNAFLYGVKQWLTDNRQ